MSSRVGIWVQIPDRSWIKIWAEGKAGDDDPQFVANAVIHRDNGADDPLPDLHESPRRRMLRTPHVYVVRVTIDFSASSTAFVLAEVTDDDENPVPEIESGGAATFRSPAIVGTATTTRAVTLLLSTQGAVGGQL